MEESNHKSFFRVENAVLGYEGRPLTQKAFSFSLPAGHATALIGRNGAGKTTLVRAILGERVLVSGKVFLLEKELDIQHCHPREYCRYLSFVPQEHTYPPDLRLQDLLRLAYLPQMGLFGRYPRNCEQEIEGMLSFFHIRKLKNRPLKALSTGERQRAFLAHALLQKPRIIVLDEPTNHLDPGAVHSFWKHLLEMRKLNSVDILVSTHDVGFLKTHCEWVLALDKGNLFYNGPAQKFFSEDGVNKLFGLNDYV